jgi:cytochrome c553
MKITTVLSVALTALLTTGSALAEPDLAAGQQAYSTCVACHGADAGGNKALAAPRLTHLGAAYIATQLGKFRAGLRGGPGDSASAQQMAGMVGTLADEKAIIDVAGYIASLDSPPSEATLSGDAVLGGDFYNQLCGACHGAGGEGNAALRSPALAGADDWYLLSQLQAFREGNRGSHAGDRTGAQMRAMAALLPDAKAVTDVVVFLHGVKR